MSVFTDGVQLEHSMDLQPLTLFPLNERGPALSEGGGGQLPASCQADPSAHVCGGEAAPCRENAESQAPTNLTAGRGRRGRKVGRKRRGRKKGRRERIAQVFLPHFSYLAKYFPLLKHKRYYIICNF